MRKLKKPLSRERARSPRMTRAQQAEKTRERIVQKSILLFNRHGVQSVSIEQIAADLKISPGHLTYYFARKLDLIEACLALLKERLLVALTRPNTFASALEAAEFMVGIYRTLWQFRFVSNGLTYIVALDRQLRLDYLRFSEWAVDTLEADNRHFAAQGYILPEIQPNSYRLLAKNVWAIWLNWLRMQQIENPRALTPSNQALYQCAEVQWSLSQHWLNPGFSDEWLAALRVLLQD
jgi:AcrR family transcriptional regulator